MRVADYQKMRREEELRRVAERKAKEEAKQKKLQEQQDKEAKSQAALKLSNEPSKVAIVFQAVVRACPRLREDLADNKPPNSWTQHTRTPIQVAFERLLVGPRHRPIEDWKPQGKSGVALFRSLAAHCLSKYNTPPFMWNVFFESNEAAYGRYVSVVRHVAQGGSMKTYIKGHKHIFPVPLTGKMMHDFLKAPMDFSFMKALRSAQVTNLGGTARLRDALMSTAWGLDIGTENMETFWPTVVQWFANQVLLDPAKVAPMCDYINHCRIQDNTYSMKGRTALTVIRGMEAWHHELNRTRPDKGYKGQLAYKPCGLKEAEFNFSKPDENPPKVEIWRFKEILTAKDLFDEGKRQGHCVGSYAYSIESGRISIWTLTKEDETGNWAMLTLEVVNGTGAVVQARGRFNRPATTQEMNIINRWYGMYRG